MFITKKKIVGVLFETVIWNNAYQDVLKSLIRVHGRLPVTLVCEPLNGADPQAIAVHSDLDGFIVGGDLCGDTRRIGYLRMSKSFGGRLTNPGKEELFKHIDGLGGRLKADLVFFDKVDLACSVDLMTEVDVETDEFGIEDDPDF